MSIYVTPSGWRALLVMSALAVGSVGVTYAISSGYGRPFYRYEQPPAPLTAAPPRSVQMSTAPIPHRERLTPPQSTYRPYAAVPSPSEPAPSGAHQDNGPWQQQASVQYTRFHWNGNAIVGDRFNGEAGMATKVDADSGIWIGAAIYANREHRFDHRIAIHADKELGSNYASRQAVGSGGYAIRFFKAERDDVITVERWDGQDKMSVYRTSLKVTDCIHVTVGFPVSGMVVGRVTAVNGTSVDFKFSPVAYRSKGECVALSGIATGEGRSVFDNIRLLPTASSERFNEPPILNARDSELKSRQR